MINSEQQSLGIIKELLECSQEVQIFQAIIGSLDPDTLDVVMQGIENLGSSDWLVGIVSHIREAIALAATRLSAS